MQISSLVEPKKYTREFRFLPLIQIMNSLSENHQRDQIVKVVQAKRVSDHQTQQQCIIHLCFLKSNQKANSTHLWNYQQHFNYKSKQLNNMNLEALDYFIAIYK